MENRYITFEQEAVAVIVSLKKIRHYLLSGPFVIYSDHQALRTTLGKTDVHGRLALWLNFMAEYEFEIRHLPGRRTLLPMLPIICDVDWHCWTYE